LRTLEYRIFDKVIIEQFIASFKKAPKKLILDFDAADDRAHGNQERRFFHGYYDHYCFLPLYVFCIQWPGGFYQCLGKVGADSPAISHTSNYIRIMF